MECQYKEINEKDIEKRIFKDRQWTPFFRQLLVSSGVWVVYFGTGLCMGAPTVMIPQLRRDANSTDAVTPDMASWLSSIFGYTAIPWVFILSGLIKLIGRKKTFTLVTFNSIAMFIAFFVSNNATQLLYSELLQGMTHGSSVTVSVIVISEYTSPKYRGLFLTIKSATLLWGIWAANTLGTFLHWKFIPLCGLISSIYPLTVFFWPESPYWLATKGRYDECAAAHRWLKGSDDASEKELETLMDSQIKCIKQESKVTLNLLIKTVRLKEFYKPLLLSLLMAGQYHFSGKFVCSIYSIEIIKRITENESAAYMGMLILDGVTVFSMYIGCGVAKIVKRRTLLLNSSAIGITFLFIISGYLYAVKLQVIGENKYVSIFLLSCFSLSISLGPMIMATSIYGELVPLRFKSSCVITIAVVFNGLHATLLKTSPYIFKSLGLHGTFLFYGISASIFTILIYKFLPETKDKTLQEIEEYFKDKSEVTKKLVCEDGEKCKI